MAPVILELQKYSDDLRSVVCVTGQHRQMLDQVLRVFAIEPDVDLNLMEQNQSLASLTSRAMVALNDVLERLKPNVVLVQGDTTTAMVASLAAFYHKIPLGHVEAGLRTGNHYSPFPEEINRQLIGVLASYHFVPTSLAAETLKREGKDERTIFLTGNTVIDALHWVVSEKKDERATRLLAASGVDLRNRKLILVTAHRRENFGSPLERICHAIKAIARHNPGVEILYPVHLNPNVRSPVYRILDGEPRVHLTAPLEYEEFAHLLNLAYLVLTDSGGIQEEGPALGKPVLVMRENTERPEAVLAGTAKLVGTDTARLIEETERLLNDHSEYTAMAKATNPFGDGYAAKRIVEIIRSQTCLRWGSGGYVTYN